jgi:hypothetical protein
MGVASVFLTSSAAVGHPLASSQRPTNAPRLTRRQKDLPPAFRPSATLTPVPSFNRDSIDDGISARIAET